MKDTYSVTEKDIIIFSLFAILGLTYLFGVLFKWDLIYIRAAINYISFNLIQFSIIKGAYDEINIDIKKISVASNNGEIDVLQSSLIKMKKKANECKNKIFVRRVIFISILTLVQLFIKGTVGDIIGDVITFVAFVISCQTTFFRGGVYRVIYNTVF